MDLGQVHVPSHTQAPKNDAEWRGDVMLGMVMIVVRYDI